eukprot:3043438-Amphidinium_carterae.1
MGHLLVGLCHRLTLACGLHSCSNASVRQSLCIPVEVETSISFIGGLLAAAYGAAPALGRILHDRESWLRVAPDAAQMHLLAQRVAPLCPEHPFIHHV